MIHLLLLQSDMLFYIILLLLLRFLIPLYTKTVIVYLVNIMWALCSVWVIILTLTFKVSPPQILKDFKCLYFCMYFRAVLQESLKLSTFVRLTIFSFYCWCRWRGKMMWWWWYGTTKLTSNQWEEKNLQTKFSLSQSVLLHQSYFAVYGQNIRYSSTFNIAFL